MRWRNYPLSGSLLVLLFGVPLFHREVTGPASILLTVVLGAGLCATAKDRRRALVGLAFLAPAAIYSLVSCFRQATGTVLVAGLASYCVALAYLLSIQLRALMSARDVTAHTLFAAINGYLLLGILGAIACSLLWILEPGCLRGAVASDEAGVGDIFYFSFVTLTTLGYGDIVPVGGWARYVATAEAVAGQLYIAVAIARLVGLHIVSRPSGGGGADC